MSVVLISIDTLRRDHLPFYGYARDTAPNLTTLAADAVVFDQAIAAHTNTAPAHASILTGLYPTAHGIVRNGYALRDDVPVLAEILTTHGYQTAAFVSGFTLNGDTTGLDRGFGHYDDGGKKTRDRRAADTVDRVSTWLEQRDGQRPLFLFLHLFDPHFPYRAPEQHGRPFLPRGVDDFRFPVGAELDRLRRGEAQPGELEEYVSRYDGEIHYADHHLGRFFQELRRAGLFEDSLVIVTSDHGETLVERPFVFDHGGRVYEEQILVPWVMRFPQGRFAGQRIGAAVHQVDLLPTLLDLLGVETPPNHGRSLLPAIRNGGPWPRRPLFSMARTEPPRVRGLSAPMARRGLIASIRVQGSKLIAYPTATGESFELFNLERDPGEQHSVAAEQPKVVERLRRELARWRVHTGADQPTPPPDLTPDVREALRALGYLEEGP